MIKKYCYFFIIILGFSSIAKADGLPATSERIQWIQDRIANAALLDRRWQYGWSTAYAGMTYLYAVQASTLNETDEKHDQYDAVVNACSSFLGFAGMMLDPLSLNDMAEQLNQLPETTNDERRIKLVQAEACLQKAAEREQRGRSWEAHAIAGLVSIAAGVVVACDGNRARDGTAMFAGSMLVSEFQIFTQPTLATQALLEYRGTGLPLASQAPSSSHLFLSVIPGGIVLYYRF